MDISTFKLYTNDRIYLQNYLSRVLHFTYENTSYDMTILAKEEFYFRNKSTQMNMIVLKSIEDFVIVEIIGGAGGSGLFNINLGSQKSFINTVIKLLYAISDEMGIVIKEVV